MIDEQLKEQLINELNDELDNSTDELVEEITNILCKNIPFMELQENRLKGLVYNFVDGLKDEVRYKITDDYVNDRLNYNNYED